MEFERKGFSKKSTAKQKNYSPIFINSNDLPLLRHKIRSFFIKIKAKKEYNERVG